MRFPEAKQAQGNWDLTRIRRIVDDALTDPEVDIVITTGPVVSNEIVSRRPLFKPVVAAIVGFYASYYADVSSGAAVVLTLTVIFVAALVFSPKRRRLSRKPPR